MAVLSLLGVSAAPAIASPGKEVLRAVHTDALHATYDGTTLALSTRIGSGGETREADPAGLIFNLEDRGSARVELPDLPAFAFLGKPGEPVWIAPESQDPELIWPGWDTETIPAGALRDDAIDLTLLAGEGPGNVEVFYNYDHTGSVPRLFSLADPSMRTLRQPVGRHVHANWAFTQLGTYTLTFEAKAVTAAGRAISSGPVEYTFVVGPYEPAVTPTATTLAASPNPASGTDSVTLSATVSPPNAVGTVEFLDGGNLLGGAPVTDGLATIRATGLAAGVHPLTARFVPADAAAHGPSTSAPVQLTVTTTSPPTTPPPTTPPPTTTPPTTPPTTRPPTTPPACVSAVLGVGHVDVAARTVDGRLRFQVKDGTQGSPVWRDPGTVAFHVRPAADETVPAAPEYRFLGTPGATIWQIPQTQADDLLWAGWNTESVDYTALAGPVRWSLDKVEGPGKVAVYQFDQFGQPLVSFDSGKALPQAISLAGPTHAHGNWAFTRQGIYRLTFTYAATTKSGQRLSDTATLPVAVGTTDLAALCPGGPSPTPPPTAPTTQPTTRPTTPPPSTPPTTPPTTPAPTVPTPSTGATAPGAQATKLPPCVSTPSATTTPGRTATTPSATTPTTTTPGGVALTTGHADYAVRLENGALVSRLKDGTKAGTPVWRDPAEVTLRLTSAAAAKAPGGAFGFLGAAGSPIWQIPQTQKDGVVWLGWNTEELTAAEVPGGIDWRLDRVEGPGGLAVFEFDSFGQPKVIFNSGDGLPDTFRIAPGTHAHGNWAFTKAGTYRVTFTHSATLASGNKSSDSGTITFIVGDTSGGGGASQGGARLTPKAVPAASCSLAATGASIGTGWIALGAVLVLLGTVAIVATRRRNAA